MSKEVFSYDKLLCGSYETITVDIAKSQTIKRGDLLEAAATSGVVATAFSKAAADANSGNVYAIAAEDVTTGSGATGKAIVYVKGKFNRAKVTAQTAKGGEYVLASQGIILVDKISD